MPRRPPPIDRDRSDYQPTKLPSEWHSQDWLLILDALKEYLWTQPITDGQELRLCQLIESIARMHGTVSLGAVQYLDVDHFDQYALRRQR